MEERGVEEIAGWYEGVASSRHVITDVRAQKAYVAQYVAERQSEYGAAPARQQKEEWKSRARAKWVKLEREGQRREDREARQERVAVAAD